MGAESKLWSDLIDLNKHVDGLIQRVFEATKKTEPISREVPFYASIEVLYENLPTQYDQAVVASDGNAGDNIKRARYENASSRVYVREMSMVSMYLVPLTTGHNAPHDPPSPMTARFPTQTAVFPINWRWNFYTSISERKYSDTRVLANAAGRSRAGNHIAFREPLIIEPREALVFETELLGGFGMTTAPGQLQASNIVISLAMSGYREGF